MSVNELTNCVFPFTPFYLSFPISLSPAFFSLSVDKKQTSALLPEFPLGYSDAADACTVTVVSLEIEQLCFFSFILDFYQRVVCSFEKKRTTTVVNGGISRLSKFLKEKVKSA